MKKYILSFISLVLFFIGSSVNASTCDTYACGTCEYGYKADGITYKFDVISDGNGALNIKSYADNDLIVVNSYLDDSFFRDESTDMIKCPTVYMTKTETDSNNVIVKIYDTSADDRIKSLPKDSSFNNGKLISSAAEADLIYTCNYTGKKGSDNLIIKKYSDKWKIKYPHNNYYTEIMVGDVGLENILPTAYCSDVFYSKNDNIIKTVEAGSGYQSYYISSYCRKYSDLEQFCKGNCKITDALCGKSDLYDEYGECPYQLKMIIAFLKKLVFNTLKIVVPIILIIMGTIDFIRAAASSDEKQIKESTNKFIRRVLTAILFFFITTIVTVVLDAVAVSGEGTYEDWKSCWLNIK